MTDPTEWFSSTGVDKIKIPMNHEFISTTAGIHGGGNLWYQMWLVPFLTQILLIGKFHPMSIPVFLPYSTRCFEGMNAWKCHTGSIQEDKGTVNEDYAMQYHSRWPIRLVQGIDKKNHDNNMKIFLDHLYDTFESEYAGRSVSIGKQQMHQ